MSYISSQIIPSIDALSILGKSTEFRKWMNSHHSSIQPESLFEGYRFAVRCCINSFIDGICGDRQLGIESDLLLDSALGELIPLHKIESSCEKTIFLKNINRQVKSVFRAKDFVELEERTSEFLKLIEQKINVLKMACDISVKIDREVAEELLLIDYTHTFLNQIKNDGPVANALNPLSNSWLDTKLKERYFEGYKFANQFLWYKILGKNKFESTHLVELHKSDSWRDYKYHQEESPELSLPEIFNRTFDLEEQTSFDSFFYWIQKEVTDPLAEKYNFHIHQIDSHFHFRKDQYNKATFSDLLAPAKTKQEIPRLSVEDQILQTLYWYPMEIVRAYESSTHIGIPSFNTMLAGTVVLHNKEISEFDRIVVSKFTHQHTDDKSKNDYSYGILVDSKSAAGHYSSGWIIYQNACSDYSGFSGSEHRASEKLIEEYEKAQKIEVRRLDISLEKFTEFSDKFVANHEQTSILEKNKLIPDILQKSKAQLLELYTYYICSSHSQYNEYKISLNTDKNGKRNGEKDVVLRKDQKVIVIECKINPQNHNIAEVIDGLNRKAKSYSVSKMSCQIWAWQEFSAKNKAIIESLSTPEFPISFVELSNPSSHLILKGIDLKQIKFIFQDY